MSTADWSQVGTAPECSPLWDCPVTHSATRVAFQTGSSQHATALLPSQVGLTSQLLPLAPKALPTSPSTSPPFTPPPHPSSPSASPITYQPLSCLRAFVHAVPLAGDAFLRLAPCHPSDLSSTGPFPGHPILWVLEHHLPISPRASSTAYHDFIDFLVSRGCPHPHTCGLQSCLLLAHHCVPHYTPTNSSQSPAGSKSAGHCFKSFTDSIPPNPGPTP